MERLKILTGSPETSRAAGLICLTGASLSGGMPWTEGALRVPCVESTTANGVRMAMRDGKTLLWTAGAICPEKGTPAPRELMEAYRRCLAAAAAMGLKTVDVLAMPTGAVDARTFQAATDALRPIWDHLAANSLPERVTVLCGNADMVRLYKAAYNFWFAGTKAARMEDAGWD